MKRQVILGLGVIGFIAIGVIAGGFEGIMTPYFEVEEAIAYLPAHPEASIEVTGHVLAGSIVRATSGLELSFRLTDGEHQIKVGYRGVIPDNFAEEQQVVVVGKVADSDSITARQLLVKCPSRYEGDEQLDKD